MKIINHRWSKSGFLYWECIKCHCYKVRIPRIDTFSYFFFRNGKQLSELPSCKSTFNNDKL